MNKIELYDALKEKIVSEKVAPGSWLVEREISEEFSVSRTPVREILRVLATDGLVKLEPTKGYSVRKLTFEELVEIFQARESLEGMTARLACTRADDDFLANIKIIKKQLEKVDVENNPAQGVTIGHSLHNAIVIRAGNSFLSEFYNKLSNLTLLTRNLTKMSVDIEQSSCKDHIVIAEAILVRDENKSEIAMRNHIKSTCLLLTQRYLLQQTGLVSNLNG